MNKKIFKYYFIFIFVFAFMVLSGGCGGSSSKSGGGSNVNSALSGAWLSSSNGTAEITGVDEDAEALEIIESAWGSITDSDVLKAYQDAKKTVETVDVTVSRVVAIFEDCDINKDSGTVKLTAVIVLSDDENYMPVIFDGATLSTTRVSSDTWTATLSDGSADLTINMLSEKINLSGTINYLDYECSFSTVIEKDTSNSLNPQTVLNGSVWNLDTTQAGGYVYDSSKIISAVIPDTASIYFNVASDLKTSTELFYSAEMKSSSSNSDNGAALLQSIYSTTDNTLTHVNGNVYKISSPNNSSSGLIFIANIDEVYAFTTESGSNNTQTAMFLPLKKVTVDPVEAALKKTWTAYDGGGYINLSDISNPNNDPEIEFLKSLDTISLTFQSGTLSFADITENADGTITATVNINASFLYTNAALDALMKAFNITKEPFVINYTLKNITITRSGNFLNFTDENGEDIYNLTFISDSEAFLSSSSSGSNGGNGYFALNLKAE